MYFETRKRDDGTDYTTVKDSAPEWVRDTVHEAHGDALPNDWIYSTCGYAFEACPVAGDEDWSHEFADQQTDIYTANLFQWASEMCLTGVFSEAEEEAKELGQQYNSIEDNIRLVQFCAIRRIAEIVRQAMTDNANDE